MRHDLSSRAARRSAGFTFAELGLALVVIVVGAVVLFTHLSLNYSATRSQKDRVFALTKAQALLAELQGYVDRSAGSAATDLDALDDGVVNKPTLSISTEGGTLIAPDHPLSGNYRTGGQWHWSRRITVRRFPGVSNRNMRYVTVRIYRRDAAGVSTPLADLSSVINSAGSAYPTTQVFDVYLVAIESIPGWWVYMDAIRPFVESTIDDLESRNPGLEVRTHWITKASYGRNPAYRPYVNEAVDSLQDVPSVYWYPGCMPVGSASAFYYVPGNMTARIAVDGTERHGYQPLLGDPDYNPYPYALADTFNHAMRYPQERAFHDLRVAEIRAAKAAGATPDDVSEEPTLRLFLDDLVSNPDRYRHALIINLHGELLPMPPLRNYSDAARCPVNLPEVRVVAHPEELRTDRTAASPAGDVVLRVYAYKTRPNANPGVTFMPDHMPIAIQVMNVDLTDPLNLLGPYPGLAAGVELKNVRGGVLLGLPLATDRYATTWEDAKHRTNALRSGNEMYYEASFVDPGPGLEKYTLFKLYQTPVIAPPVVDGAATRGLPPTERGRLYGMDYVPCPCENPPTFANDLTWNNNAAPRNTARWTIRIPRSVLGSGRFRDQLGTAYDPPGDVTLTVRTRIWDPSLAEPMTSGTMYPAAIQPDNVSETYTWWADSSTDVPVTERAQFQGDPRHLPYRDCWNGGEFANAYNWYWDTLNNDLENAYLDFPAIDQARLRARWNGGLRQDLPRLLELLRTGLVESQALWTTLTGFSYYYCGIGGEIGYDAANGYPTSIPVNLKPFGGGSGTTGFVDTITGAHRVTRGAGAAGSYWWSMPWLGELCPDTHYAAQWLALDADGRVRGNLDSGPNANQFRRDPEYDVYWNSGMTAYGTRLNPSAIHRTSSLGCTALFNAGTSGSTFHHTSNDGQTGNLIDAGPELAANYNFPLPANTRISRPFGLALAGGAGPEFGYAPYSAARYGTTMVRRFYNHQAGQTGSGLVQLRNPAGTSAAYIVVNGLDRTLESGSAFIAKYSLLSMVQSFFECGNAGLGALRVKQPARVEIDAPTEITELDNPSTITIQWHVDWKRWDGLKYTTSTSTTFTEPESEIEYVLTYSRDGGTTWCFAHDDAPAQPGVRPAAVYLRADTGPGQESWTWPVPAASFPAGSYLIRIEAYRQNQALHYSQHQVKVYIER
jgi:hypothetical protein